MLDRKLIVEQTDRVKQNCANRGVKCDIDRLVQLETARRQKLHEVEGLRDHREDLKAPLEEQYGPAHEVELARGGLLQRLAGKDRITVNSLHSQGVQTLGRELDIEARAPDGVVEAFSVRNAPSFAVAVQWHPEWQFSENPFSVALFAAFGEAARERAHETRKGHV